jgi:hypothetical protein
MSDYSKSSDDEDWLNTLHDASRCTDADSTCAAAGDVGDDASVTDDDDDVGDSGGDGGCALASSPPAAPIPARRQATPAACSGGWPAFCSRPHLRQSAIAGAPPTLVFGLLEGQSLEQGVRPLVGWHPALYFALGSGSTTGRFDPDQAELYCAAFGSGGLARLPNVPRGARWTVRWASSPAVAGDYSVYRRMTAHQAFNHFPASHELGHKHLLHRHIERQRHRVGDGLCAAFPRCFHLCVPEEAAAVETLVVGDRLWMCGTTTLAPHSHASET